MKFYHSLLENISQRSKTDFVLTGGHKIKRKTNPGAFSYMDLIKLYLNCCCQEAVIVDYLKITCEFPLIS